MTRQVRCGKCQNCLDLERVKHRVLACCNPIHNGHYPSPHHADDGVVEVWNTMLERLPCTSIDDIERELNK